MMKRFGLTTQILILLGAIATVSTTVTAPAATATSPAATLQFTPANDRETPSRGRSSGTRIPPLYDQETPTDGNAADPQTDAELMLCGQDADEVNPSADFKQSSAEDVSPEVSTLPEDPAVCFELERETNSEPEAR